MHTSFGTRRRAWDSRHAGATGDPPLFPLAREGGGMLYYCPQPGLGSPSSSAGFSTAGNCYILKLEESQATHFQVRRLVLIPSGL